MARCAGLFQVFRGSLLRHFRMEEEVLFPGFETATGSSAGPTQMRAAVDAGSADDFLGAADTLMVLMQQHNMKEEGILYPMCDQVLAAQWARRLASHSLRLSRCRCRERARCADECRSWLRGQPGSAGRQFPLIRLILRSWPRAPAGFWVTKAPEDEFRPKKRWGAPWLPTGDQ